VRILKAATLSLFLVTLGAASVNAQAQSPARTEARSPLSEIAHNVSTWFSRRTGTDGKQQGSLPARLLTPLPRPRPTELTSVPVAPNTDSLKPTAAPVPSNDEPSKPTAASVPPNDEPSELTTATVPTIKEPSELTAATVPTIKEPSELTAATVPTIKEPSELTAAPAAPKKKAPAPVLIND
jgi:hypothetical protein